MRFHFLLGSCMTLVLPCFAAGQPKPNVIVVLTDDMGIGDTSAYLGKRLGPNENPISLTLRTPNMERLAQLGTVFTDVHAASACSQTRYGLLTGRHGFRSELPTFVVDSTWTNPTMIDRDRSTVGNLFQKAGYDTAAIGKWHLGATVADKNGNPYIRLTGASQTDFNAVRWPTDADPTATTILDGPHERGFDSWYGLLGNSDPIPGNVRGFFENDTLQGVPVWQGNQPVVPSWDITKVGESYANKLLDMIDQRAGVGGGAPAEKPLFMYYAPMANHSVHSPAPTITIQGDTIPVYNTARRTDGIDQNIREDMINENDIVIGKLLDKLQSTIDPQTGGPMIDNTLLIVTADNGADGASPYSAGGLRERKQSIYEGGQRVPFMAVWPGQVPAGGVSDQLFSLTDLYASFASLTGQTLGPEEAEDSENVLPAILGASTAQFQRPGYLVAHDDTVSNDIPNGAVLSIRSGNMKLILASNLVNAPVSTTAPGQATPLALYDLNADLKEQNNLVNDPQYAGVVDQLKLQALQYRNQGFSRTTIQSPLGPLLLTDGGAKLSSSLSGAVGYSFTVGAEPVALTRLGMWDDAAGDVVNQESALTNQDGNTVGLPDGLAVSHWVRLFDSTTQAEIAAVEITNDNSVVEGEFRYVSLPASLNLAAGRTYALTMSTPPGDGDLVHLQAPLSGNSPVPTSSLTNFLPLRAPEDGMFPTLLPDGTTISGAPSEQQFAFRFFTGPTATLAEVAPSLVIVSADFNNDHVVDGTDFLIWQRGLGMTNATHADGDAEGNGIVDEIDLLVWQSDFGVGATPSFVALHHVPEPAALPLAMLALWGVKRLRGKPTDESPSET